MHEPVLTLEGGRVRAEVDGKSYLLGLRNEAAFWTAYRAGHDAACAHFTVERTRRVGLQDVLAERMRREIVMHWLYFYTVNRLPMELTPANLTHPATRRIVHTTALTACGASAGAASMAAQLAGQTEEQFARWLDAEERQHNR